MNLLTNGTRALHPLTSKKEHDDAIRFEPALQHIAPSSSIQWWGTFAAGDRLAVRVRSRRPALLALEILDQDFRRLAVVKACSTRWIARAELPRAGIAYVRVHDTGGLGSRVVLELAKRGPRTLPARAARPSAILSFFGLRRAA
jgi:hypothetical protein